MKHLYPLMLIAGLLLAACQSAASTPEPPPEPTLDPDDPLVADARMMAEDLGISVEEAVQRARYQETIGEVQAEIQNALPDTFAGLWIQNEPDYGVVIALTEGDRSTVEPFIAGYEWAPYVSVQPARYSLAELEAVQQDYHQSLIDAGLIANSYVDVKDNIVVIEVADGTLFREALDEVGLGIPEPVEIREMENVVVPQVTPGGSAVDALKGGVLELTLMDRSTLKFPYQAPTNAQMGALMQGTLIIDNNCLRITPDPESDPGFLVIWPAGFEPRIGPADGIDIVDASGEVIAHPGDSIQLGGGAMESEDTMANWDTIPGMPIEGCPGPYWIAGDVVR